MPDPAKTEKATPKRRNETRKKGNVAKSTDMNGAVVLSAGLIGVAFMGPRVVSGAATAMRTIFGQVSHPGEATSAPGLHALLSLALKTMLTTVAPIAGMCVFAAFVVNVAQVGFKPTFQPLKPSFGKLNPISGVRNLFGPRMPFEGAKAIAKVTAVGAVGGHGPGAPAHPSRRERRHASRRARAADQLERSWESPCGRPSPTC